MRRSLLTLLALLGSACPGERVSDAGAPGPDAVGLDAVGPDAPGLDAPGLDAPASAGTDAPSRPVTFSPTDEIFGNPERGFYRAVDLLAERDLSWLSDEHPHDRLVYSYVMLDRFRDRAIDATTLDALRDALAVAREDGFEVVVRFAYNLGPYPDSEPDAPLSRIREHLGQLRPVLREGEDVIAVVQAGFIGAWGEWHTSTNGLDTDPSARRAVVEALLDAVPASRSTQIRYPLYLSELAGGSPLDASRAWDGSFESRLGFHNDCFLSSDTDVGTYPDDEIDRWKAFIASHGATWPMFTPRTIALSIRSTRSRRTPAKMGALYTPVPRVIVPSLPSMMAATNCHTLSSASVKTVFCALCTPTTSNFAPAGRAPTPSGPWIVCIAAKNSSPSGERTAVPVGIVPIHFGLP